MAALLIGRITVRDAALWAEYRAQVGATIAAFGGEVLFRGRPDAVFDGPDATTDVVVVRFPDRDALHAWHASPAYQALVPLRRRAAEVVLVGYRDD